MTYLIPDCIFMIIQTGLGKEFVDNLFRMLKCQMSYRFTTGQILKDFGSYLLYKGSTLHTIKTGWHTLCVTDYPEPHVFAIISLKAATANLTSISSENSKQQK